MMTEEEALREDSFARESFPQATSLYAEAVAHAQAKGYPLRSISISYKGWSWPPNRHNRWLYWPSRREYLVIGGEVSISFHFETTDEAELCGVDGRCVLMDGRMGPDWTTRAGRTKKEAEDAAYEAGRAQREWDELERVTRPDPVPPIYRSAKNQRRRVARYEMQRRELR